MVHVLRRRDDVEDETDRREGKEEVVEGEVLDREGEVGRREAEEGEDSSVPELRTCRAQRLVVTEERELVRD